MTPRKQYGYLALRRVHGGIAKMPDGEKKFFESLKEAEQARIDWATENALTEARKKAEEERRDFIAGCTRKEERIKQPGLMNPDLIQKRVLSPTGEYLGDPTKEEFDAIVERAAEKNIPEPNAFGLAQNLEGGVETVVVWAAHLYLDGESKRLPAFVSWTYGLPIEEVLAVLNEIAADGWQVVQVSEDRGIYSGETNQTASAVTTARYLLARDA